MHMKLVNSMKHSINIHYFLLLLKIIFELALLPYVTDLLK